MSEPLHFEHNIFSSILLVDDNEIDNFVSSSIINKLGIAKQIISKNSAEDALDYLTACLKNSSSLPEIILLDIRMPSMDGFDFLREFEKFPPSVHSECNIFILSSSIDSRDIERAKQNRHVLSFITKPLTFNNIEIALSVLQDLKPKSYSRTA